MKTLAERYKAMPVSEQYFWRVVALSFVGWIFIYGDRTILNPVQKIIGAEFGLDNASIGLMSSAFFFAYAFAQIPFGALGSKIGRRLVICVGFLLTGIATALSGIATGFFVFLVYRALAGIGEGSYYGPQYALSGEAIPTKKLTVGTAIINSGMAFGTSGGFLLSSYLVLEKGMHWSTPFFIMAVPTIIVGILFQTVLHERVIRPEDQNKTNENVNHDVEDGKKMTLGEIFANKNLLMSFILLFCSIYANFVILTWLPQYLQVARGYQGTEVGWVSSLIPWTSIVGALTFAWLNDKFHATKKLAFVLVPLAMVSTFGIAYVPDNLLIPMLLLYGFTGKLALDPILVSFVTKNSPKLSLALILSAYNFIGMSASILAPYVTGYLSDITGTLTTGFYLGAGLLLVGLICFSFIDENATAAE